MRTKLKSRKMGYKAKYSKVKQKNRNISKELINIFRKSNH